MIKRQFFRMITHVSDNSKSLKRDFCNRHLKSCNMLFGTWSQARAYDPSDYIETRLELYLVNELNRSLVGP